jgi:hypothetical protein
MGLSRHLLGVFHKLAVDGDWQNIGNVMELGSQGVVCEGYEETVRQICATLGKDAPSESSLTSILSSGSTRGLYEALGIEYNCLDTDGKHGALTMDLNFDVVPEGHKGQYGLTTNFGTTEHLINQLNAFKIMHDFTKAGGLMFHDVPFHGHVNHGFFNYQPCFFESLARFNSYEILGLWLQLSRAMPSMIPWEPRLMDHLVLPPKGRCVITVLLRKMNDLEFCVPFQGRYELVQEESSMSRYTYNVDGEYVNGARNFYVTSKGSKLQQIPGRALARELLRRIKIRLGGKG